MSIDFIKKWWKGLLYEPNQPPRKISRVKIVVIGGGTGLSVLLRGLKQYSDNITAVVAVTDDGASSGLIKKEFDTLPPGDVRKCISALAKDEKLISKIMEYRFSEGKSGLSGHTLGNIWIAALTKYFGSFAKAVQATTEIFETAGKVIPATLETVDLCAKYKKHTSIIGESNIPKPGKRITGVYLSKDNVRANPKAVAEINRADMIIFGPGSLYTSVIPNLLIPGIAKAIRENSDSLNIYVCNCSTERGETENYLVADHIKAIFNHIGGRCFDYCMVNSKIVKKSAIQSELGNINNITTKENEIEGVKIVRADLLNSKNPLYHDSNKLAKAVITLYNRTVS